LSEFDLSTVRTYPLASRPSKVRVEAFAKAHAPGQPFSGFLASLPDILGAADLRKVVTAITRARERGAPVVWGIGGHVVKTGVAPVLVDLMRRGFVSALAMNGAALIHDFEIALSGGTSEDVDASLGPGRFGMAEETGSTLNQAIRGASDRGDGLGQGVAAAMAAMAPPHAGASLLCAAHAQQVPLTVHVALGTDVIHMHAEASGAAIGDTSLRDFRRFAATVSGLAGGVYVNCGSAVILPEVFLKAVALARNAGHGLEGLTTVNIDFLRMYRPETNVVTRPVAGTGGAGYSLVGQHEILIPLLAAALVEA